MPNKFYSIVIPNVRYKYVKPFQLSVLMVNTVLLAILALFKNDPLNFIWPALLLLSALIILYESTLNRYTFFRKTNFSETGFLWAITGWALLGNLWIAFAVAIVGLLQGFVKKDFQYLFTEKKIELNAFPKQIIDWQDLQNVILKDGMLTIDRKNNKIIQTEISLLESGMLSEAEFNEFCRLQLSVEI